MQPMVGTVQSPLEGFGAMGPGPSAAAPLPSAPVVAPPPGTQLEPLGPDSPIVQALHDRLSAHVEECYTVAKRWKDANITPQLEDALRRRKGEYDASKLAQISALGGCDTFFNLTETKAAALMAWLHDVILPLGDNPWALEHGAISDLPPDLANQFLDEVSQVFAPEYEAVRLAAQDLDPAAGADLVAQLRERVQEASLEMAEKYKTLANEEAQARAESMTVAVTDQLEEGGWREAIEELLSNLASFQLAILKGPVLQGKRRMQWNRDGTSSVVEEPQVVFSAPSPFDIYPSPNARTLGGDWLVEVVRYSAADLQAAASAPGWIGSRVMQVLNDFVRSRRPPAPPDQMSGSRALLEQRPDWNDGWTTQIEGREYWGVVPGEYLLDWASFNERALSEFGFEGIDPARWYPVTCLKIGQYVVKAAPVLDPLGMFPYHATAFEKIPGSLWGRTVADKIKDCQDVYNATLRAMVNNLAFAAGPALLYDTSAMGTITRVQPYQTLPYDGTRVPGTRQPVQWWQQQCIAEKCMSVAEFFSKEADTRSGIPRYEHGDERVGGAGSTASGLSMMMGAAAKGIKRTLAYLDRDIIRPAISQLVRFNNAYATDQALKGDVRVVARGALYVLTREAQTARHQEFIALATSPAISPYIREEGVAHLLREQATQLDLPADKIVRTDEEIQQMLMAQQQQAAIAQAIEMQQQGGKPGAGNPGDGRG